MTIKIKAVFHNIPIPQSKEIEDLRDLQNKLAENHEKIVEEFKVFRDQANTTIQFSEKLLTKQLDSDPVSISEELNDLLSCSYTVGQMVADTKTFMTLFNVVHHCPKQHNLSEIDRKRYTEIKTLEVSNFLNRVENIEDKLDKKIIMLQSILKFETARLLKERN